MDFLRFINPNYHVILIHYPLALLGVGLVIEIFSFLWRDSSVRIAGRWMILLGALATIPAVTSGIFAKADVFAKMHGSEGTWVDVKSDAKLTGEQWKMFNAHVLYGSIGSGVAVLAVVGWLGGTDGWRRRFYLPALLLLVASMGIMAFAAYNAGELFYRTGLPTMSTDQPATWPPNLPDLESKVNFYVDVRQVHVIAAGFVFAVAAGALGMSLRKTALAHQAATAVAKEAHRMDGPEAGEIPLAPISTKPPPRIPPVPPRMVPAARFWVVTALLGLATAAGGWYVTADTDFFRFGSVYRDQIGDSRRMLAHLILGGSLVVLPIILAVVSRTRSRVAVWFFGLLMIAVVAAQIGVGVLLLYDGSDGSLMHFNSDNSGGSTAVAS